ncbi:MAG: YceI family protein [Haliscomenobacter sp.]|nr:YceI family protein [Haliscomenobacter sp.]
MKNLFLLLLAAWTISSTNAQSWTIDKTHTDIRFTVTHMTISEVDGEFKEFDGKVVSKGADFNGATVEFTAKTASVNTDSERRDGHLKGADFFDAEKHPELKFKGALQKKGKAYLLVGDFTMKGVTKPVKFNAVYTGKVATQRGAKAGFKITGTVNRFDYGVKWDNKMDTGGLVVGENVQITCNVELNEAK